MKHVTIRYNCGKVAQKSCRMLRPDTKRSCPARAGVGEVRPVRGAFALVRRAGVSSSASWGRWGAASLLRAATVGSQDSEASKRETRSCFLGGEAI